MYSSQCLYIYFITSIHVSLIDYRQRNETNFRVESKTVSEIYSQHNGRQFIVGLFKTIDNINKKEQADNLDSHILTEHKKLKYKLVEEQRK